LQPSLKSLAFFMRRKIIFLLLPIILASKLFCQTNKLNDYNSLIWLQTFNTIKINNTWGLHAEYQWRRTPGIKNWQQGLLRLGVNYKVNKKIAIQVGYANVQTYNYGTYPVAALGRFPEHRLYQQLVIKQHINKILLTHRLRLEQRLIGKRKNNITNEIDTWIYSNRFRYSLKGQYNFNKKLYGAIANEVFYHLDNKLSNTNFDQNRINIIAGFKAADNITLELGYLNQLIRQGKPVNNNTIIQRNNGFILGSFINF
jgi:Protein of unknown function (DUF2490)